jgi:hypothetical protein
VHPAINIAETKAAAINCNLFFITVFGLQRKIQGDNKSVSPATENVV